MEFFKYHGAGNDFIMVDQRQNQILNRTSTGIVAALCHRRFGIGADGLILLQNHTENGIEMIYFNADGRESTLCGNGGRCFAAFARYLGLADKHLEFMAIDGVHEAVFTRERSESGLDWVELKMQDLSQIQKTDEGAFVLNTGSPHFVQFCQNLPLKNMVEEGRAVRYRPAFEAEGINVNLVEPLSGGLAVRTYERGVEDETLACGTGVTAAVLAHALRENILGQHEIAVTAQGGQLAVRFHHHGGGQFTDIWLGGPAQKVFQGNIDLPVV